MVNSVNSIRVLKAGVQRCLSGKPLYDIKCWTFCLFTEMGCLLFCLDRREVDTPWKIQRIYVSSERSHVRQQRNNQLGNKDAGEHYSRSLLIKLRLWNMVNLLLLLLLTRIWFNVRSRVVTNLLVWLGDRNKNKELKKLFFYWCLLVVIMISTPSYCNFLLHLFNSLCYLQNETLILWAYPNKTCEVSVQLSTKLLWQMQKYRRSMQHTTQLCSPVVIFQFVCT